MIEWAAILPNALGATVAAYFAWLARRAHNAGPESVAGGYSTLVADMRREHVALKERVSSLEKKDAFQSARIRTLETQLREVLPYLSSDARRDFHLRWGDLDEDDE